MNFKRMITASIIGTLISAVLYILSFEYFFLVWVGIFGAAVVIFQQIEQKIYKQIELATQELDRIGREVPPGNYEWRMQRRYIDGLEYLLEDHLLKRGKHEDKS